MCVGLFFFFKQKTAYEMRISDWSSDVCSSDLDRRAEEEMQSWKENAAQCGSLRSSGLVARARRAFPSRCFTQAARSAGKAAWKPAPQLEIPARKRAPGNPPPTRSEEHTSELQSLMRISYAVFCLKKTKKTEKTTIVNQCVRILKHKDKSD